MKMNNLYKHIAPEIPLVSLCGKELNFITPEDPLSCVVFNELDFQNNELLFAGGGIKQSFLPSLLCWSLSTERLYYPLTEHKHLSNEFGLIHPDIFQRLSEKIQILNEDEKDKVYTFEWKGEISILNFID
jgi:hypothetical protein